MNYLIPRTGVPRRRDDDFAPHRLCAHITECIDGVSPTLKWAAADALATLPPLTERGHDRAFATVDRALQGIAAQPADTRMAFVVALTYHLHEHTPATRPWRTLREKIDRACAAIGEAQVLAQDEAAEALYRELYPEATP